MKILGRLAAAIGALCILCSAAQAEIKKEWVEYSHGSMKLKGYLVYDDSIKDKRPAVLMVHRRDGMSQLTLQNTELYASMGYVAFAPDIFGYGQGILPKDVPEAIAQMDIYVRDRELMRARTLAGLDVLKKHALVDDSKIALVGYCFGGMVGVELIFAGTPLSAMVSIHGSFNNHPAGGAKNIKGTKVMILHGAEDTPAPLSEVDVLIKEFRTAKTDFQIEIYSGANHGFSAPRTRRKNARMFSRSVRRSAS